MKNIQDIKYELDKCNNANIRYSTTLTKYLSKIIFENETIKSFTRGIYNLDKRNLQYYIILTDRRLLMARKGIFSSEQVEIPLEKINSVAQRKDLFSSGFNVWDSSGKIEFKLVPRQSISPFINTLNAELNNYKTLKIQNTINTQENPVTQLERLASLYKQGLLTEYEFSIKKKEILSKN